MKKIFLIAFLILILASSTVLGAVGSASENEYLNLEKEITSEGTFSTSYKSNMEINKNLFEDAVKNAADKKKASTDYEASDLKELRTDVLLDLENADSSFSLSINKNLADYTYDADSLVVNAGGVCLFVVPSELSANKDDIIEISVDDNSEIIGEYTGESSFNLSKKIFAILFIAAGVYIILFLLLVVLRKNVNHKKLFAVTSSLLGAAFLALGIAAFIVNIDFEPQNNSVELSQGENPTFTVTYGNSSKIRGIYLGIPLFSSSFTEDFSAAYLKGESSSDTVIGGNYSSNFDVLKFPITTSGEYYIKNNDVSFSDINSSDTDLSNAVSILASKNIVNGKTEGIFGVKDTVTRAETVTMLCKLLYLDTDNTSTNDNFSDVDRNKWYYNYVMTGRDNDILQGYEDNTFRAENTITKQEFVSVLGKVMTTKLKFYPQSDISCLNIYTDSNSIVSWASGYAALLEKAGIRINADEYEPTKAITRGEAAQLLYGVYRLIQ